MAVNESKYKAIKRNTRLLNLVANPIKNKLRKELNLTTELAINSYKDNQQVDEEIYIEHRTRLERIALEGFKRAFDLSSKSLLNTFVKAKFITREQSAQVQNDINITRQNFIADNAIKAAEKMAQTTENIVNKIIDSNTKKLTENSFIEDLITFSLKDAKEQNIFRSIISAFSWSHTGIEKGSQDGAQRTEQNYPIELFKIWITMKDGKVRDPHVAMEGVKVPVKEPFIVDGEPMMYPGDMSASVANWINCLHPDTIIDYASPHALTRREYVGKMITIKTKSGNKLTVTPNHPILTMSGWKLAHELLETDSVISADAFNSKRICLDVKNTKTPIEKIYNFFSVISTPMRCAGGTVNFHGEIPEKDIYIIRNDSLLLNYFFGGHFFDPIKKLGFKSTDFVKKFFFSKTLFNKPFRISFLLFSCYICIFGNPFEFFQWCLRHSEVHCITSISGFYVKIVKTLVDLSSSDSKLSTNRIGAFTRFKILLHLLGNIKSIFFNRCTQPNALFRNFVFFGNIRDANSTFIFSDDIVDISHNDFSGFVYNLSDEKEYYVANGIIAHNCRCVKNFWLPDEE